MILSLPDLGLWSHPYEPTTADLEAVDALRESTETEDASQVRLHHILSGYQLRRLEEWGRERRMLDNEKALAEIPDEILERSTQWELLEGKRVEWESLGIIGKEIWAVVMDFGAKAIVGLWDELFIRQEGFEKYKYAYDRKQIHWQNTKVSSL